MTNTDTVPGRARFEVRMTADTHFGWLRTRLSIERTMMSWIRTAVSLIGFGFAIVQFFDRLQQTPGARSALIPGAPRYLGLALIGLRYRRAGHIDLSVLVDDLIFEWRQLRPCRRNDQEGKQSPVIAVAVLLILIGFFAFFAVLLRLV